METVNKSQTPRNETIHGIMRTFINDKNLRPQPPRTGLFVLAYSRRKFFRALYSKSYARKRVDSNSAYITCSYTYSRRDQTSCVADG